MARGQRRDGAATGASAARRDPPAWEAALRAMLAAEREVFRLIVAGPVYRFARMPASFDAAVAALRAAMSVGHDIDMQQQRLRVEL